MTSKMENFLSSVEAHERALQRFPDIRFSLCLIVTLNGDSITGKVQVNPIGTTNELPAVLLCSPFMP
jgi:hypothetical protein